MHGKVVEMLRLAADGWDALSVWESTRGGHGGTGCAQAAGQSLSRGGELTRMLLRRPCWGRRPMLAGKNKCVVLSGKTQTVLRGRRLC